MKALRPSNNRKNRWEITLPNENSEWEWDKCASTWLRWKQKTIRLMLSFRMATATVCKQNTAIMVRHLKWFYCSNVRPHQYRRIFVIKALVVCTRTYLFIFHPYISVVKAVWWLKTVFIVQNSAKCLNSNGNHYLCATNESANLFRGFAVRQVCFHCINHYCHDYAYYYVFIVIN